MATTRKPVNPEQSEIEKATALVEAHKASVREAELHAIEVAKQTRAAHRARAAQLKAHYEGVISDAMRAVMNSEDGAAEKLTALIQEAHADCSTVTVEVLAPSRGRIAKSGRVQWHAISDAAVIVSLRRCVELASAVGDTGLNVFSQTAHQHQGRAVLHPVYRLCLTASEVNSPSAWVEALDAVKGFLSWFRCGNQRQGSLIQSDVYGYDQTKHYRAWVNDLCEQVYSDDFANRRLRASRSSLTVHAKHREYI